MEDLLNDITKYNEFLEEKTARFNTQASRSLAAANDSSNREDDVSLVNEQIADLTRRSRVLNDKIRNLRSSLPDRHTSTESDELFQRQLLAMTSFPEFFKEKNEVPPTGRAGVDVWPQCNRIVQHIQEWGKLVTFDTPESNHLVDDAQEFVNDMVLTTTRHCQVQLSSIFHRELGAAPSDVLLSESQSQALKEERASVLKEIEWLWEEVIPVSHMCVVAEFLKPILERQKGWARQTNSRNAIVANYASEVLKYLNQRLYSVSKRTRDLVYYHQALRDGHKYLQANAENPSSLKLASSTPHRLPLQHTPFDENMRYFTELYGVPLDIGNPDQATAALALEDYVRKRSEKGEALQQDIQRSLEKAARANLTDHERSKELLLDCLCQDDLSEAQTQDVFRDAVLEESIEALEKQTNQVSDIFRESQLGGPATAAEFVVHTHSQIMDRLAADKSRKDKWESAESGTSLSCVQDPKIEEFVRKWGEPH